MRKNRSFIARFAALALIFNALVPFFATYEVPGSAAAANAVASPFGEKLLICTGDGFKWIDRADIGKQGGHTAPSHFKCALCYLAAHGLKDSILPDAVGLASVGTGGPRHPVHDARAAAHPQQLAFHSRAPPSPSFA